MKDKYPDSKSDLFAGFLERVVTMVRPHGYMAQVTMQSWMFLSSYEKLRSKLQRDASIVAMLHMDNMVMRIAFGTSATVWGVHGAGYLAGKYTWVTVDDIDGDAPRVFPAHNARNAIAGSDGYFTVAQSEMAAIPGSPIVYWLSEKMRTAFRDLPALEKRSRSAKGLVTADNATFVRFWWEVSRGKTGFGFTSRKDAQASGKRWFPYAKGGEFRRWAGNMDSVVDWEDDGRLLQATLTTDGSRIRATNFNLDRIFRQALVWTVVTSGDQSFRIVSSGSLFDAAAGICQSDTDEMHLAVLNSSVVSMMLSAINPTLNLHPGYLGAVPIPAGSETFPTKVVKHMIQISEADWDSAEASWNFQMSPLISAVRDTQ